MNVYRARRLARAALLAVLAATAAPGPAAAEDPVKPRPFAELLAEAESAFGAKSGNPFAALVQAIDADFEVDPWIVADKFAAAGSLDLARAFAASGKGPRWTGLGDYLAGADAAKARPDELALRVAVLAVDGKKDAARVLDLTDAAAKAPAPRTVLALDTLRLRARALFVANRGADTIAVARVVLAAAEKIGWTAGELEASTCEGMGAQQPIQMDVLASAYTRGADLARSLGNAYEEGRALGNLAVVRGMAGDYAASLEAQERAADAYERAPPSSLGARDQAVLWMNLGEIRTRIGEAAGARIALDRAVGFLRASAQSPDDADTGELFRTALASLCNARLLTGDITGALATLRELTDLAQAASDADALARAAAHEGRIRMASGEWKLALKAFTSARDRFAERADEQLRLRAVASIGCCLRELGRASEAIGVLRPTIESQALLPDTTVLPYERRELGEALAANGETEAALRLLRESLDGALELGQREDATRARIALAETLLANKDAAAALAVATMAVEEVPGLVRDTAQTDAAATRRRWGRSYDAGLRAALALGDAGAVVRFLESGRAGALLEGLGSRDAFAQGAVAPVLLSESKATRRARAGAELALADAVMRSLPLKEISAKRAALAAAESGEREVIGRIQRESRASARVVYPSPVDDAAARADLSANEALIIYRVLPERTVAAVLTRSGVRVVSLAAASTWESDCVRLASFRGGDDAASRAAAATRLLAALVTPLHLGADMRTVLVSPDGALVTAPLALLFPDRAAAMVPSATTLHALRAAPRTSATAVLGLGDPNYARDATLAPLPGTRAEVAALRDPKVTLLGAEATPNRLLATLAKGAPWRAVHLACHGIPHVRDPWSSAVALAATADSSGRVTALELAATPIRADLVTLSACELAGGRVVDAEGAVGVPQALLIAGARCVLANLWRADDDAAQLLMKTFYDEWRDGRSGAAEALRIAQARVRSDPRWKDSRYWAGWVLWGSAD